MDWQTRDNSVKPVIRFGVVAGQGAGGSPEQGLNLDPAGGAVTPPKVVTS